jgi:hypothetical protein
MWSSRAAVRMVLSAAPRARLHLDRPQVGSRLVEHAVDVLVAVGAAEVLRQLDRLVDGHLVGHVDAVLELVGADHQHAVLDGRQLGGLAVHVAPAARRCRRPRRCSRAAARRSEPRRTSSKPSCSRMWASITPASPPPSSHSYRPCSAASRERRRAEGGAVAGRARLLLRGRGRFGHVRSSSRLAISMATRAASRPLSSTRAQACASFSTVRMALAIGTGGRARPA